MNDEYISEHNTRHTQVEIQCRTFEAEVFVNCKIQDDCDCILQLTEASGSKHPALYLTYVCYSRYVFCSETPLLSMQVGRE